MIRLSILSMQHRVTKGMFNDIYAVPSNRTPLQIEFRKLLRHAYCGAILFWGALQK
jgi:hypothetical protein